jgi:hypothetical protein
LKTHNVALATSIAQFAVFLGSDGRIAHQGYVTVSDQRLDVRDNQEEERDKKASDGQVEKKSSCEKLVSAEHVARGRVSWSASGCRVAVLVVD